MIYEGNKTKNISFPIGASIELCSYGLPQSDKVHTVRADGKALDFRLDNGEISFDKIRIAHTLEVIFG